MFSHILTKSVSLRQATERSLSAPSASATSSNSRAYEESELQHEDPAQSALEDSHSATEPARDDEKGRSSHDIDNDQDNADETVMVYDASGDNVEHDASQDSPPSGARIPPGPFRIGLSKERAPYESRDPLDSQTITLVPTKSEYRKGSKTVAVNRDFICYAVRGGRIRIIAQSSGNMVLLKGHNNTAVVDMAITQHPLEDDSATDYPGYHLISVGLDDVLCVWKLSHTGTEISFQPVFTIKGNKVAGASGGRWSRVEWDPSNVNRFAVTGQGNDVYMVDLAQTRSGGIAQLVEAEGSLADIAAIKILPHSGAVNDLRFTADGSVLGTASKDGVIRLWDMADLALLHEFTPFKKGVGADTILFAGLCGDVRKLNTMLVVCSSRNLTVDVYNLLSFDRLHSVTFDGGDAKSNYNNIAYDSQIGSLIIANSTRESLYTLHLQDSVCTGAVNIESTSALVGNRAAPFSYGDAKLDFIVEFPIGDVITSLVVVPYDSIASREDARCGIYCVLTKAVRHFYFSVEAVFPGRRELCPLLPEQPAERDGESEPVTALGKDELEEGEIREEPPHESIDQNAQTQHFDQPPRPPSRADPQVRNIPTPVEGRAPTPLRNDRKSVSPAPPEVGSGNGKGKLKARASADAVLMNGASGPKKTPSPDRLQNRSATPEAKVTSSQAVMPGLQEPESATKPPAPSAANAKPLPARPPSTEPCPAKPDAGTISLGGNQMDMILAQMNRMEENIVKRVAEAMASESEKQRSREAQLEARLQQSIAGAMDKAARAVIPRAIQGVLGDEMNRAVTPQITELVSTQLKKIEKTIGDSMQKAMTKPALIDAVSSSLITALREVLENSFKEIFANVLIPRMQSAVTAMFVQIHETMESGLQEAFQAHVNKPGQRGRPSPEALQATINDLSSQIASLNSFSETFARAAAELQTNVAATVGAELRKALAAQEPSGTPLVRRWSQQAIMSPIEPSGMDLKREIDSLIDSREYESAFIKALEHGDLSLVMDPNHKQHVCCKVNPKTVFRPDKTLISQPVILSMMHQISLDFTKNPGVKLGWLQDCIMNLNKSDPLIAQHATQVVQSIAHRLDELSRKLATEDPANARMARMLVMMAQGLT
ncbi:enhancer of mRNA decapping 4 [Borealophlyctis nickersoniae]|nr:enhancer of mRNA decapping 4 [Borealophlyctis nickersoniae]